MQSKGFLALARGVSLRRRTLSFLFASHPLRPSDYELFGMYWEGSHFYDKVLPGGLRSAPFLFNLLPDAIEWILLNECLISFVCHILDDFFIIEPATSSLLFSSRANRACPACSCPLRILVSPLQPTKQRVQVLPLRLWSLSWTQSVWKLESQGIRSNGFKLSLPFIKQKSHVA